jgi:predicted  nucleic acid-binding Zn-ribbon protein
VAGRAYAIAAREEAVVELRRLRSDATARYTEVDLLVSALKEHIRDLRRERDELRGALEAERAERELAAAGWLWRGSKGAR